MIKKEEALSLYRKLILARRAEEKIREGYFNDEMKTPVHLGIGGEAISVGVCHCLPEGTKTFGTYRNHALYLAVTDDTDGFFAELYGKATGPGKGKAGSMHISAPERGLMATSAVVGTPIPVAVGAALANAYRKSPDVVAAFFGDGAVEEGVFWESLNFSCLHRLRILFVCEDNGLAIHTPAAERQGFRSIPEAIRGFNCHLASGNGSNVLDVVKAAREVLWSMSQDPKPAFLHLTYLRFLEHVGVGEDFKVGYRSQPTPEELETADPVRRLEKYFSENGVDPYEIQSVQATVEEQINRSVEAARQAPFAASSELLMDVYA